jgi:hypothetical protein
MSVIERLNNIIYGLCKSFLPETISFDRYLIDEQDNIKIIFPNNTFATIYWNEFQKTNWCTMNVFYGSDNSTMFHHETQIRNLDHLIDEIEKIYPNDNQETSTFTNPEIDSTIIISV